MPVTPSVDKPDPAPSVSNIITFGKARFVLLTERFIRMEWSVSGEFEDRATLTAVNRSMPRVKRTTVIEGRCLEIKTGGFTLHYTDDGKPFSKQNLKISFSVDGKNRIWDPSTQDRHNLQGTIRTLDNTKGSRVLQHFPAGKRRKKPVSRWVPIELGSGLISRSGWSLVDDSRGVPLDEATGWVVNRSPEQHQDWYLLLYGYDYREALHDASMVFGRQPVPPRYAFGYWWSRYWAYTDKEVEELVGQFDSNSIPLDVMVLDMDWHLEGWTGYTWDGRYFPDPEEFLKWLHSRGLKITLNLHPADGVGKHEKAFASVARAMGVDPRKTDRVPMDVTSQRYVSAYFRFLHHPLEKQGVDFWWMDWQQGHKTAITDLDPLPWINHLHWKDMEANPARKGKRPLIFSRYGGLGAGRYCVGFSGDTHSVWESLQYQPRFTATASNVLYGYWSHDIGGHMPGPIEPELYVRWLQFGVFSPILRTHTSKDPDAERRVWAYPEPYRYIMAKAIRLRYELVPYIYTEARRCWDTGVSICRPMYYDYPRSPEAYQCHDQYMFGESMIVAPVLTKADSRTELASVRVWLPDGQWFDTARGVMVKGGGFKTLRYLVDEVPVFVRPGTVLPGQQSDRRIETGSPSNLVITAYPGGDGEYLLYEDDGESEGYRNGQCVCIPVSQKYSKTARTLRIGPARGSFRGFAAKRSLEIRLPASVPPRDVRIGRRKLKRSHRPGREGWSYDGAEATVVIRVASVNLLRGIAVTVTADQSIRPRLALGLKGVFARLNRIAYYNTISTHCLVLDPEERTGIEALQAGNRMSRDPAVFSDEVRRLARLLRRLPGMFRRLGDATNAWQPERSPVRRERCDKAAEMLDAMCEDF